MLLEPRAITTKPATGATKWVEGSEVHEPTNRGSPMSRGAVSSDFLCSKPTHRESWVWGTGPAAWPARGAGADGGGGGGFRRQSEDLRAVVTANPVSCGRLVSGFHCSAVIPRLTVHTTVCRALLRATAGGRQSGSAWSRSSSPAAATACRRTRRRRSGLPGCWRCGQDCRTGSGMSTGQVANPWRQLH